MARGLEGGGRWALGGGERTTEGEKFPGLSCWTSSGIGGLLSRPTKVPRGRHWTSAFTARPTVIFLLK